MSTTRSSSGKRVRVMAVASEGGHWVQLSRLAAAFEGTDLHWVSTNPAYAHALNAPLHCVTDANMWEKLKLCRMFLEMALLVFKLRPDVVVTTGAAPGYAALVFGRIARARTIWIDSIANSETMSSSGKQARKVAHVCLSQWEHVAKADGADYWGAVL